MNKDMEALVKAAEKQGWEVTYTGGGHYKFKSPTGSVVFTSSTPGRNRSLTNSKARLKRAGLKGI